MGECILQGGGGGVIPQLCEQVDNILIQPGRLSFKISWNDPTQDMNDSYVGVRILRKIGSCPQNPRDGVIVYEGAAVNYTDTGLTDGTTYYYRAFAYNSKRSFQNSMRYVYGTAASYTAVSDLPVGSLVSIPIDDADTYFIVAHQGKPGTDYADSCEGTWLVSQNILYTSYWWESSEDHIISDYGNCTMHNTLNTEFLHSLSTEAQHCINEVRIPYHYGNCSTSTCDDSTNVSAHQILNGENGLLCKVFLLSLTETGISSASHTCKIGTKLDYFSSNSSSRIARLNDQAQGWWTRHPYNPNSSGGYSAYYINASGSAQQGSTNFSTNAKQGIRPTMVLNYDSLVYPVPNQNGAYELVEGQV